jgi:hypothetical protein
MPLFSLVQSALMQRLLDTLWIVSVLAWSWLAMLALHELGHVLNALLSGGTVARVWLHPFEISRTDVLSNPHPQFVAWGGVAWGVAIPLALAQLVRAVSSRYAFLAPFFGGFCCLANGLYLAAGSWQRVGDAGDLIRHGASVWQLLVFGGLSVGYGMWLWHGLGPRLGLVDHEPAVSLAAIITSVLTAVSMVVIELAIFAR